MHKNSDRRPYNNSNKDEITILKMKLKIASIEFIKSINFDSSDSQWTVFLKDQNQCSRIRDIVSFIPCIRLPGLH